MPKKIVISFEQLKIVLNRPCGYMDSPLFVSAIQQSNINVEQVIFDEDTSSIMLSNLTEAQTDNLRKNLSIMQKSSKTGRVFTMNDVSDEGIIKIPINYFGSKLLFSSCLEIPTITTQPKEEKPSKQLITFYKSDFIENLKENIAQRVLYIYQEGIKLGLSSKQISTLNFGYHTINAIETIRKRTPSLSIDDSFEMVKGKLPKDTESIVRAYLAATQKAQKPINEMNLIRVIVNPGRGFGHQRAAITLMQKLREIGFKGTFDIQCGDNMVDPSSPVSLKLIRMILGVELARPNTDGIIIVSGLGAIKISSLPKNYKIIGTLNLPKADLVVCAADDYAAYACDPTLTGQTIITTMFNASLYIGLQPTDWRSISFVINSDNITIRLPSIDEIRLSSIASYQPPDINSVDLLPTENKVLNIIKSKTCNTQLVYGLYPEMKIDPMCGGAMVESGNLDEATEMQRLIEANLVISKKTNKPSVLLLPQQIALNSDFRKKIQDKNHNIYFVDLTVENLDSNIYKAGDIVVAYTGFLQQKVFDYLMLEGTTLPPVIEGCNSLEACESAGRSFIHGSAKHNHLTQYRVLLNDKQKLHTIASLCLEQGEPQHVPELTQYMEECLALNSELLDYHAQRREAFFKRLDACEVALDMLGVKYEKSLAQDYKKDQFNLTPFSQTPRPLF